MPTDDDELNTLRQRCEDALAVYQSASGVLEARLRANENPTADEWRTEECARAKLSTARRALAHAVARSTSPATPPQGPPPTQAPSPTQAPPPIQAPPPTCEAT
jgi:hypothetical protein